MCGTFKPTNAISVSYGLAEKLYSASYLKRQCDEFMKLGLQGTTVVVASGDAGVAGRHGDGCINGGSDRHHHNTVFNPAMPASCPYVTSVGSTIIPPARLKSAVEHFFAKHDPGYASFNISDNVIPVPTEGVYNRIGRGFPDVAALGDNAVIVFKGGVRQIGGKSMSAPIFASIMNLINEERIKKGKRSIGFANPALYKNTSMFNDVVVGDQLGTEGSCHRKGFSTAESWDPVTGLGTPRYPDMLAYFLSLP
ncbi:hypothetical protein VHEMI10013 [[Torrubiella] hemipterigena]|uniref:Peptidase S53 domain-containing protein n=1 Tax=[Torrubiella] hemipterigena TaxID=1531966 RepID=A0A0A1TSJ7_9HYPO|nr:hypothetical protein VHEMI10013 [[Torrubiella] hemipterigena]